MPNGQQEAVTARSALTQKAPATEGLDQEVEHRQYIVEKLRSKRDAIGQMPVEKQLAIYGVAFDREIRPTLTRSGISEQDLDKAKDNWIIGLVAPGKQHQLGEEFGRPEHEGAPASAFVGAIPAGVAGASGKFIDWLGGGPSVGQQLAMPGDKKLSDLVAPGKQPQDKNIVREQLRGTLSDIEGTYSLAQSGSEKWASRGAGVGKAIPTTLAFMAGEGAIPTVAKGAPKAYRMLQYLSRMSAGTAASTVPFEKTSAGDVAKQTAYNVVFDALLHGAGKGGSKGLTYLVSKAKGSAKPEVAAAANAVDDLFGTVIKEKFPDKKPDDLSLEEFNAVFKEASARREAAQQTRKEAAKAVRDAERAKSQAAKPTPATPEAKALAKAQRGEQLKAERQAASEKQKQVAKQLAEYKKRVGALPGGETEHFKRIAAGETVEQILGQEQAKAVQAATQVATEAQAKVLAEGAPTAVEAVQAVQQVERRVGERKGIEYRVPQIGKPGKPGVFPLPKTEAEQIAEQTQTALAGKPHGITPDQARAHIDADPAKKAAFAQADERQQTKMLVAARDELIAAAKPKTDVKAKIAKTTEPKKSRFNIDIAPIQKATTPEEFISAKKDAMAQINKQAIEQAKAVASTAEKTEISRAATQELHRIRSMEVSPLISGKKVKAVSKAATKAQGVEELTRRTAEEGIDVEDKMIAQVDKSKELTKWFIDNKHHVLFGKVTKEWQKSGMGDIGVLNEMLEEARGKLTPLKE